MDASVWFGHFQDLPLEADILVTGRPARNCQRPFQESLERALFTSDDWERQNVSYINFTGHILSGFRIEYP